MPDGPKYVPLAELASAFGLDKSNTRKYALKAGFMFTRVRTPGTRGQLTLALPSDDADRLLERRQDEGYAIGGRTNPAVALAIADERGCFYVIQVVPDLAPNRVKLGFAGDVESRLSAHRTVAPTARLVKAWPCRRAWEAAAIASITRSGSKLLGGEVYDCDDLATLVTRVEAFFALMPRNGNGK
jgi:hypothetical protein